MTDAPRWRGAPTPDDERRAAAFEARVARLDAASWGRLDAIGAAIAGGSPTARWRRARLDADFFSLTRLLPPALARSLAFTGGALFDAAMEAGALWYRVAGGPPSAGSARAWCSLRVGRSAPAFPPLPPSSSSPHAGKIRNNAASGHFIISLRIMGLCSQCNARVRSSMDRRSAGTTVYDLRG